MHCCTQEGEGSGSLFLEATVTRCEGIACKFFALTWTGIHVVGPSRTDVTKCIFSSTPHNNICETNALRDSLRDSPKRLTRRCIKDVRLYGPDDARTRQRREARREARRKIFDLTTLFDARTSSRSEAEVQQSSVTHPHKSRTA